MKWNITIPAVLLFALVGYGKNKQSTDELITVDIRKKTKQRNNRKRYEHKGYLFQYNN